MPSAPKFCGLFIVRHNNKIAQQAASRKASCLCLCPSFPPLVFLRISPLFQPRRFQKFAPRKLFAHCQHGRNYSALSLR